MTQLMIDHIVSDPEHRHGKPRIKGTGITVQNIVEDTAAGLSAEYIVEQFDLTLGQVYAALSYYYDHRDEIDDAIAADKAALEVLIESNGYKASQERTRQIKSRFEAHRKSDQSEKPLPDNGLIAMLEEIWQENTSGEVEEPIDYREILNNDFPDYLMRRMQGNNGQTTSD